MTATEVKHMIKECGSQCELCGSTRNLEIHHIIPAVTGYRDDIIESKDNLICLCGKCHGALTPKGLLIRCGLSNVKDNNQRIASEIIYWSNALVNIQEAVFREWDGYRLSSGDMYDIWDENYAKALNERAISYKLPGYKPYIPYCKRAD